MKKFQFDITKNTWRYKDDDETCQVEAPNLNMAIMKLALEHDLYDVCAIYIRDKSEDEDDE